MAIIKKPYEISVWDEKLGENGQKTEIKRAIIGANDMSYIGRATSPKLTKNLNGTHTLTFQMPSKFFDSEKGEYIHNEFCDNIFNERKVKLKYDGEWYEFYVKNITENKQFKSIMYQYTCEDAFIDELSRNGYGITFDTELYNNVEEIGSFTEIILDNSIWEYDASKNWGDFTEYAEEKLFKIPVAMFSSIPGYKLNYIVDGTLTNVFGGETRNQEMGDDLSREQKIFWDNGNFDNGMPLLQKQSKNVENDGYIYIPYSCLDFCYINSGDSGYAATQEAASGEINGIKSYYLAPSSTDPTSLIQFIAIPSGAEVQIDEAGLLVNKNYSYVMTLKDWNECVKSNKWYNTEKNEIQNVEDVAANKIVCYNGYLEQIGDTELTFGKKISITDRTEINISEEIDQYVKVYNNTMYDFINKKNNTTEFTSDEWDSSMDNAIDYRICSSENTRTIVPQLARNLVQNGTEMTDTSGWEVMKLFTGVNEKSSSISVRVEITQGNDDELLDVKTPQGLILDNHTSELVGQDIAPYQTFINFGIVGQEETISKDQTYVLYIDSEYVQQEGDSKNGYTYTPLTNLNKKLVTIIIGEGGYDSEGDYTISESMSINVTLGTYYFIRPTINIDNPYFAIRPTVQNDVKTVFNLKQAIFCKAYTKGADFFDKEKVIYKYTGRDIFFSQKDWSQSTKMYYRTADEFEFLKEDDIVEGDVYSYKKYFRQQVQAKNDTTTEVKDSFMLKSYLNNDAEENGFKPTEYTEENIKVATDYIDLNRCKYYNKKASLEDSDCLHQSSSNGVCMYQKYGYCPYRFQTQKHCRKIRTLNGEKSNRFNLTQELSKVFEIYPIYYTEHEENGKVITDLVEENGKQYKKMRKKVFYITEKGVENKLGFKYTKNLSNISRTFDSKEIVTKLYVEDVDSELSKTGLCSIKTAEDNPSKDSYIIDFSYYIMRGLLDKETTEADLYGIDGSDMGYLKQLGYYNKKYDELSNLIINLQDESYNELAANVEVNLAGIETAQQELNKINKSLSRYSSNRNKNTQITGEENDTYLSYKIKYNEQKNILLGLIEDTFMTNGKYYNSLQTTISNWNNLKDVNELLEAIMNYGFKIFKKEFLDTFLYRKSGLMGQYVEEYLQIQEWKKQKAKYLEDINRISLAFYRKYEPYLKEGTWSDSNYLSDNSYYFGAKEVAKQGAIPKLTYNISVIDLSILDSDYKIDVADTTYIEDIETFGINEKTGLPNRLKVIISGITYNLDIPIENSIQVQNHTTQFEDLFQQISASVQSLTFNENIYKRSSNFTSAQNISEESLQGGLSENQLTLIETDEKNITLDNSGQSGSDINNHANKYKLSGEGLFFSNNGGQTWNVGVTPKGINADYIKVGSLDASKISIIDGEYLYFLWDKGGITAYRTPQATVGEQYFQDFARFNKYGLSLVEDGKIKLRAGYQYKGPGAISEEEEIGTETPLGFYLYNSEGREIFSTQAGKDAEETARIQLSGEIFVTDSSTSETVTHGNLIEFTGQYRFKKENVYKIEGATSIPTVPENFNSFSEVYNFIPQYMVENGNWDTDLATIFPSGIKVNNVTYTLNESNKNKTNETSFLLDSNENLYKGIYEHYSVYINFIKTGEQNITEGGWAVYRRGKRTSTESTWYKISDNSQSIYIQTSYKKEQKDKFENTTVNSSKIAYYIEKNGTFTKKANQTIYFPKNSSILYGYETYKIMRFPGSDATGDGEIGLYINNKETADDEIEKIIVTEEGDINLVERLFCCAKKVNQKEDEDDNSENKILYTSNIFTVLKNGELYFGGEIQSEGKDGKIGYADVSKLPSKITITDAYMKISSENLYIDFDKIRSMSDPEMDLLEYVEGRIQAAGSMIALHKHEIKTTKKLLEKNTSGISETKEYYYYGGLNGPSNSDAVMVTWGSLMKLFNSGTASMGSQSGAFSFKYRSKIEQISQEDTDKDDSSSNSKGVIIENYYDTFTETAGSGGAVEGYMIQDPVDVSPDEVDGQ